MQSPFPGMDPYLEEHWRDVHHRFLTYACDDVQAGLPDDLRARLQERPCIEPNSEPVTEGFIEVIPIRSSNRIVTVVELMSYSNKLPGETQHTYFEKHREYVRDGASLVEIDLLRTGGPVSANPLHRITGPLRTPYHVCVTRGWRPDRYEFYPMPLREPLPSIPVPLRSMDSDVPLNLQSLIERCYRNGRYDDLDYRVDPVPPLDPADAAWADSLLRTHGLR